MANELILATNTVLNLHSRIVCLCLTPVSDSFFFFSFLSLDLLTRKCCSSGIFKYLKCSESKLAHLQDKFMELCLVVFHSWLFLNKKNPDVSRVINFRLLLISCGEASGDRGRRC